MITLLFPEATAAAAAAAAAARLAAGPPAGELPEVVPGLHVDEDGVAVVGGSVDMGDARG